MIRSRSVNFSTFDSPSTVSSTHSPHCQKQKRWKDRYTQVNITPAWEKVKFQNTCWFKIFFCTFKSLIMGIWKAWPVKRIILSWLEIIQLNSTKTYTNMFKWYFPQRNRDSRNISFEAFKSFVRKENQRERVYQKVHLSRNLSLLRKAGEMANAQRQALKDISALLFIDILQ